MKRLLLKISALFMLSLLTACEKEPTSPQTPNDVKWIQKNTVPLTTIHPDSADLTDLEPLKETIGDARLVLLGEASHGSGGTFLAKSRLVKFLHQEMGFDVLAFESDLYTCHKAEQNIQSGQSVREAMAMGVEPHWSQSRQVVPLMDYLQETRSSASPITLAGFDIQFNYQPRNLAGPVFLNDLRNVLAQADLDTASYPLWEEFKEITVKLLDWTWYYNFREPPPPDTVQARYRTAVETLWLDVSNSGTNPQSTLQQKDRLLWSHVLDNLRILAHQRWTLNMTYLWGRDPEEWSQRDLQMAENLIFLADVMYPGRKIVVWAHTTHICRNLPDIELLDQTGYFNGITTLGDMLWNHFGDAMYAVGFTAFYGEHGLYSEEVATPLGPPPAGSLEDLFYQSGPQYAFLDFRQNQQDAAWLNEYQVASPVYDYRPATARWPQIMDGLVYIETMTPSTQIP